MADVVQELLEQMVPELEDLQELGIFTSHEIKSIVKQRRKFEYLLKNRTTVKSSYLKYIKYEIDIESLRQKRKKRLGLRKSSLSDHSGKRRIHHIFQRLVRRFPDDPKLWMQYASFCQRVNARKVLGTVTAKALQRHPRVDGLWILAASSEFNAGNVVASRTLLQRALRVNAESKKLWYEYFRLELLYINKMAGRRQKLGLEDGASKTRLMEDGSEAPNAAFFRGVVPTVVFSNATKAVPNDLTFQSNFLDICLTVPNCPEELIFAILEKIKSNCSDIPHATAIRAKFLRKWAENKIAIISNSAENNENENEEQARDRVLLNYQAERDGEKLFEEALERVRSKEDEQLKLWMLYVQFVATRSDYITFVTPITTPLKNLEDICKKSLLALRSTKMKLSNSKDFETILQLWGDFLLEKGRIGEAEDVFAFGEEFCAGSAKIWLRRMNLLSRRFHLEFGNGASVEQKNTFYEEQNDLYKRSCKALKGTQFSSVDDVREIHLCNIDSMISLGEEKVEEAFTTALQKMPGDELLCLTGIQWAASVSATEIESTLQSKSNSLMDSTLSRICQLVHRATNGFTRGKDRLFFACVSALLQRYHSFVYINRRIKKKAVECTIDQSHVDAALAELRALFETAAMHKSNTTGHTGVEFWLSWTLLEKTVAAEAEKRGIFGGQKTVMLIYRRAQRSLRESGESFETKFTMKFNAQ
eukprot:g2139.t1